MIVRPNHRSTAPMAVGLALLCFSRVSPFSKTSADDVRQQSEKARALDRPCKLSLFLRRYCGDAARHDLAALGDIALQQTNVLVIDLGRVGARERAGLAAAEERPACLGWWKAHGSYSALPAGASSLGG